MVNQENISLKNVWFLNMDEYLTDDLKWIDENHPEHPERMDELIEKLGGAQILREICPEGTALAMEHILSAQAAGDADVCRIIDSAVYRIGIAISNIIRFTCPRIMFIDGVLFGTAENQDKLLEMMKGNLCSVIRTDTEFIFVKPDDFSGAEGAAALAIYNSLESCLA